MSDYAHDLPDLFFGWNRTSTFKSSCLEDCPVKKQLTLPSRLWFLVFLELVKTNKKKKH